MISFISFEKCMFKDILFTQIFTPFAGRYLGTKYLGIFRNLNRCKICSNFCQGKGQSCFELLLSMQSPFHILSWHQCTEVRSTQKQTEHPLLRLGIGDSCLTLPAGWFLEGADTANVCKAKHSSQQSDSSGMERKRKNIKIDRALGHA